MRVRLTVFFCASKAIEVEVPDRFSYEDGLEDYVRSMLDANLPEVHEGSSFEFPTGFQVENSDHVVDLRSQ